MKSANITLAFCFVLALPTSCNRPQTRSKGEAPAGGPEGTVLVVVVPHCTRRIGGESELDRKRYFAICDPGTDFDRRVGSQDRYRYLTEELNISFGRRLGVVNWPAGGGNMVREDPLRPGFADLERLRKMLTARRNQPSPAMLRDFSPDLDVAAHGQHNAYPEFMGKHFSGWLEKQGPDAKRDAEYLPRNIEAAAELAANVLKNGYDDFDRPRYFEPLNEPHWSYLSEPEHLANWHLAARRRIQAETPGVRVGGPCLAMAHFPSRGYKGFKSLANFLDATGGQLDFYSFHVYDFYQVEDGGFGGAIIGGLPMEGLLDRVQNHTILEFGKEVPLVVSETGGYLTPISAGGPEQRAEGHGIIEQMARERFPGSGFEWQMKARSIHEFIQVNSTIAHTLVFMDHPHVVEKSVPFMLLETAAWDPRYYAALYVRKNFDPKSEEWVPTTLHDFYRLFRDLKGRRVVANCPDPDIIVRAFVDGRRLQLIAHNLAEKPEILGIDAPEPVSISVRRYGRRDDLTPFLEEEKAGRLGNLAIGPLETLVITATYGSEIEATRTVEETAHYGNAVTVPVEGTASIQIPVPDVEGVQYASLRIGCNRPAGSGRGMRLQFNGHELQAAVEDSAPRYDHPEHGYSTTKMISIDPAILEAVNEVLISFPDGGSGTIGSAVLRVGR